MSTSQEGEDALAAMPQGPEWPYDAKDRVVLGWRGLIVGILVSHLVFGLLVTWAIPTWGIVIVIYSALPAWGVGAVAGTVLDLGLRRLRNQWLHVAAFFATGALICVPFGGFSSWGTSLFPVSMALAAGIGRLSVWRLVHINKQRSLT